MSEIYILGEKIDKKLLKDKILNLVHITYRNNFQKMKKNELTNDIGWGCTFRSSQMLLANCLIKLKFNNFDIMKDFSSELYVNIILLFLDNYLAKFSIHNFFMNSLESSIEPGKWQGPSTTSHILTSLINSNNVYENFRAILCENRIIYYHELMQILEQNKSILILLPMRLGLDKINDNYKIQIKNIIKISQFCGIIGGEKNSSYYFNGIDHNNLIYLDPHKIQ